MSGGQYVAAAYGVFLVFLLAYVAIIAAKLSRLERETEALTGSDRDEDYPAGVPGEQGPGEGSR